MNRWSAYSLRESSIEKDRAIQSVYVTHLEAADPIERKIIKKIDKNGEPISRLVFELKKKKRKKTVCITQHTRYFGG